MSLTLIASCNYNCVNDGYIAWENKAWYCCTLSSLLCMYVCNEQYFNLASNYRCSTVHAILSAKGE